MNKKECINLHKMLDKSIIVNDDKTIIRISHKFKYEKKFFCHNSETCIEYKFIIMYFLLFVVCVLCNLLFAAICLVFLGIYKIINKCKVKKSNTLMCYVGKASVEAKEIITGRKYWTTMYGSDEKILVDERYYKYFLKLDGDIVIEINELQYSKLKDKTDVKIYFYKEYLQDDIYLIDFPRKWENDADIINLNAEEVMDVKIKNKVCKKYIKNSKGKRLFSYNSDKIARVKDVKSAKYSLLIDNYHLAVTINEELYEKFCDVKSGKIYFWEELSQNINILVEIVIDNQITYIMGELELLYE